MKKSMETIFKDRINTIAKAIKANYFGANALSNLPKEQVYKHVSRYSCSGVDAVNADEAFRIDMSSIDTFCIKNGIWQEFLVRNLFKHDVNYFENIPVINRSKAIFKPQRSVCTEETADRRVKTDNADCYVRSKKQPSPQLRYTTIRSP